MIRSGTANLPLHYGRVPAWLSERMRLLGGAITEAIITESGTGEFLSRISDPFWFQSFGAVMGMDWHSSGITTSVMHALKKAVNPIHRDLGIYIAGGRGKHSRNTPAELTEFSERTGLDGEGLVRASKLSAKVDNTCIQDGYSLYLHNFIISEKGEWAVIQQGMNDGTSSARRYHWHSAGLSSFTCAPHSAVIGKNEGNILNLTDSRSMEAQNSIMDFISLHPDRQIRELNLAVSSLRLNMPVHHEIRPCDVNSKRLASVLALAYEAEFSEFSDALLVPGMGPRTVQALALVSEIIYGKPSRFRDPARFAFAHGGKDGHPAPVPLKVYDRTIHTLKKAVSEAKIGNSERLKSIRKLDEISRYIENNLSPECSINEVIKHEKKISSEHGGRTVFDGKGENYERQLDLF